MTAGGEADDHNAIGVDLVIPGPRPHGLNGATGVDERHGEQIAVRGEPVAENEGSEAARREPVCHLTALQVGGEMGVGAARQHDYG